MWIGPGLSLSRNCANTSLVGSIWPMRNSSLDISILEHDLRANALRLSRGKTGFHPASSAGHAFPDHALASRRFGSDPSRQHGALLAGHLGDIAGRHCIGPCRVAADQPCIAADVIGTVEQYAFRRGD